MIKARIEELDSGMLWLVIDGKGKEGTAWALTKDEILRIRDSIDEYLVKKSQNIPAIPVKRKDKPMPVEKDKVK